MSSLQGGSLRDVATETTLQLIKAKTDNLDVLLSTRTKPSDTQLVSGSFTLSGTPNFNLAQVAGATVNTGNGTAAGSQRICIASDNTALSVNAAQSGTWNINNVSGTISLPTGASTAANQTTIGSQTTKINDGTSTATILNLSNNKPLATALVDGSGNQITSFGGGTQFADGAARGTATGTLMMVDDGTLIQSASGDSSGRLNVNVIAAPTTAVTGPLTDAQLRATAVPVSLTSTTLTGTSAVNVSQINGATPSMGNGASGSGVQRVTIASDSTGVIGLSAGTAEIGNVKNSGTFAVQASQSGTWNVGTVTTVTGATINNGSGASAVNIQDGGNSITVDGTVSISGNPADNIAQWGGTPTSLGQKAATSSVPVVIASDQTTVQVSSSATTPTATIVPVSQANTVVLASNTSRKYAEIYNDSNFDMYLKEGTTASWDSYSRLLRPRSTARIANPTYTGQLDAFWNLEYIQALVGNFVGRAVVTEVT